MLNIPIEITIGSFSLVGILTGYIWNDQAKRIGRIEKEIDSCPFPTFGNDIAKMKNDIDWIKRYLIKN